jgi:hypothetical protein
MITLSTLSMLIILIALKGGQYDQAYQDCQGYQDHQDDRAPGNASLARPRLTSPPTIAACVKRFCLDCLGATSGRGAFDCQSRICPLYQASPLRRIGRRRASKGLVISYCRHCQPGDLTDCGGDGCALFAWRPWQPGGQPKARTVSDAEKKHLLAIGQSSQFQNPRQ